MIKKLILLALVITLFGCKQGPTNEQLKNFHNTLNKYNELDRQGKFTAAEEANLKAFLKEESKKYDLKKMNYKQMWSIIYTARRLKVSKDWIMPSFTAMANQKSDSAGLLQCVMYSLEGKDEPLSYDQYMKMMTNPSVLLSSNLGNSAIKLFNKVDMTDSQFVEFITHLIPNIDSKCNIFVFNSLTGDIWKKILNMGSNFPTELKEQYYQKVLKVMEAIIAEGKDINLNNLISTYETFNTLAARGELIGTQAPEINFIWNSAGIKLNDLTDLRGKVVVLDFWATWCGPCVRAFPNVRKLQERYKDYPVVILGVTSIQGRHIDRSGAKNKTIDTKGNPEEEFNLMKGFIRYMNMTWNVAFAKQNVYNPNYGIRGIPHIAILDTEGRVRYNGINPLSPPHEEAEKIDALLKEAGLKYPEKPMEHINYAQ